MVRALWGAAVVLMAGCSVSVTSTPSTAPGRPHLSQGVFSLPNHRLTPGAYDPHITKAEVCNGSAAGRPRKVTAAMKAQVRRAYGLPASFSGEIDHLISRELGGTDVVANLWPEPGPIPNPKDRLENRLKALVCSGWLTLAQARHAEVTDWVVAYKEYVR